MRIVLVRHGESTWNVERRIQGQSGTGLTARGLQQARRTADLLADAYRGALVASSDLQRCSETVTPIAAALGAAARPDRGLRERHFGGWTGLLAEEVAREDAGRWERWRAGEDVVGEVGGETTPELVARVVGALRRLVDEASGRPLVCVTHGGPIYHGTHALLGVEQHVLGGVANASVTELEVGEEVRLVSWNQVAHLPAELRVLLRAADGAPGRDREPPPVGT